MQSEKYGGRYDKQLPPQGMYVLSTEAYVIIRSLVVLVVPEYLFSSRKLSGLVVLKPKKYLRVHNERDLGVRKVA